MLDSLRAASTALSAMFDEWRVVPRLMGVLWAYIAHEAYLWYISVPDPNNSQGAFASAVIAASVGFCKLYLESGPHATSQPDK